MTERGSFELCKHCEFGEKISPKDGRFKVQGVDGKIVSRSIIIRNCLSDTEQVIDQFAQIFTRAGILINTGSIKGVAEMDAKCVKKSKFKIVDQLKDAYEESL